MFVFLRSVKEEKPGAKWQKLFDKAWPFYKEWFLQETGTTRPTYLKSKQQLEHYMPELASTYKKLCDLAGGGDVEARFLSMWSPPAYMTACSQLAWNKQERNYFLIRNYDYVPRLFEGVQLFSNWNKKVIGTSDSLWGLLDGINEDGLVVSLTFGGRKVVGKGFGVPLIVRYLLETCSNTQEAVKAIQRIPSHMAYNLTIIDANGKVATCHLTPGMNARVYDTLFTTNHQEILDWEDYMVISETREREHYLGGLTINPFQTKDSLTQEFLKPPLYNKRYDQQFGTIYTAYYNASNLNCELIWPNKTLSQSFDGFKEQKTQVSLASSRLVKTGKFL